MSPTVTLNDLIQVRLAEIAEDAWDQHRVMRLGHGDGRVLEIGSAATWEMWTCHGQHGNGLCGEALVTSRQASVLLGLYRDDEPIPDPQIAPIEIELLDEGVGGFMSDALFHWSDVVAEYRKAQG
ncbi:hypothetical protein ABZ904_18110 [Streptomyces sp. NPDC046900]|uniref:hypothetical protein n=1 Tax=Streptomyces sp. NPDC046900 TaxID=3155473 RepID=UPI0034057438